MLKENAKRIHLGAVTADVMLATVLFGGLLIQPTMQRADFPEVQPAFFGLAGAGVALINAMLLSHFGVYHSQRQLSMAQRVGRVVGATGLTGLALGMAAFSFDAPVHRSFPALFCATLVAGQALIRFVIFGALSIARRAGNNYRNVLIVGAGPMAEALRRKVLAHPQWGLRIVGFLDDGGEGFTEAVPTEQVRKFVDLPMLLRNEHVDEVFVACPRAMIGSLAPVVAECALIGVPITLLSDLFGDLLPPPRASSFDSTSTLRFAAVHHNEFALATKRSVDIVGAAIGLLLIAPLIGVSAALIKLTSPGPILFKQLRSGLNGRPFEMLKLRTMVQNAEAMKSALMAQNEMDGPVFKMERDPRVTGVGRLLRRLSIDELPQLWNVLVGEMSLVGPRPPTPDEVVQYEGSERRRLSMRPGLTCLWQVSGRNEIGFEEWMRLDLQYIDEWSLFLDLKILLATIPTVLTGRGAS